MADLEPDPADAAAWGGTGRSISLWIDDEDWDEKDLPKRPWLIPGTTLRGSVTLLSGPPSAMKSSLILSLSVAMALFKDFGSHFCPCCTAKTIVYNTEDDLIEQRRRLSATLRYFGAKPIDIRGKVIRIGPKDIGTLFERDGDGKIRKTNAMDALVELIEREKPGTLAVDPLAELHNVEENDNTALRTIIAEFRKLAIAFNMAVIVLHHTRKGSGQAAGDPDAARGASSIIGAVRVAMTLTGMTEADAEELGLPSTHEARSFFVRLDDAKSNYAPLRSARWFEKVAYLLDNGEEVTAAVPWMPLPPKNASLSDLLTLAAAIERGAPDGQPWARKLERGNERSVLALLVEHGFTTKEAQEIVLAKLQAEHGVSVGSYKKPDRKFAMGLRIGDKPVAAWK